MVDTTKALSPYLHMPSFIKIVSQLENYKTRTEQWKAQ